MQVNTRVRSQYTVGTITEVRPDVVVIQWQGFAEPIPVPVDIAKEFLVVS